MMKVKSNTDLRKIIKRYYFEKGLVNAYHANDYITMREAKKVSKTFRFKVWLFFKKIKGQWPY